METITQKDPFDGKLKPKKTVSVSTAVVSPGPGTPIALSPTYSNGTGGIFSSVKSGNGSILSGSLVNSGSQHTIESKNDDRSSQNSGSVDMKPVTELLGNMSIPNDLTKPLSIKSVSSHTSSLGGSVKMFMKSKGDGGITICPPGAHGQGPWNDSSEVSPILARKFENNQAQKIHVITIGKPFNENNEDVRRIKIYEHQRVLNAFDFPFLEVELREHPKKALAAAEDFMKAPNSERKMVDKAMSRSTAVKALTAAQNTLNPMYGGWLNPVMTEETGITASSDTVFVLEYCVKHGLLAKSLSPLRLPASSDDIKAHIMKNIGKQIEKMWDNHAYAGFSFAVVSPMGKGEFSFYA